MLRKKSAEEREQVLRELLKKKGNNRCVNCSAIGPQYVITKFKVFVCTTCSGIHRTFGHRVKGIYMSSFTDAEVDDLSNGGNDVFFSTFCASWRPDLMPRPGNNDFERCHNWIDAVYEKRKYFSETEENLESAPSVSRNSRGESTSEAGNESVVVMRMTDVVVGASVIVSGGQLSNSSRNVEKHDDKELSVTNNSNEQKLHLDKIQKEDGSTGAIGLAQDLASDPSAPVSQSEQLQSALSDNWDPFGLLDSQQPAEQNRPSDNGGWAVFDLPNAEPPKERASTLGSSISSRLPDLETAPEQLKDKVTLDEIKRISKKESPMLNGVPMDANVLNIDLQAASLSDASVPHSARPSSHQLVHQANPETPLKEGGKVPVNFSVVQKDRREEVPLDSFFPEFERIRATGILPTGQFVRPLLQSQAGNLPAQQSVSSIQYVRASTPAASFSNESSMNLVRSSYFPSTLQSSMVSPSYVGMNSQQYSSPALSMQYAIDSPGQGFGSSQNPSQNMMPSNSVNYGHYSPVRPVNAQVFSPSINQSPSSFSDGGKGLMQSQWKEARPEIKSKPADAASATLYGQNLGLTAYNLNAPAAPQAHLTGNPFA